MKNQRRPYFCLAFRSESILPIELELQNLWTQTYEEIVNYVGLMANLDVMDKMNDLARRRVAAY